ncbi:MAG: ATP-dependent DNA helicase PcrA, partial [Clostridia bacterium]|nr:ATP-dependent DNA helicase PcrA [Clostridia bacterium]
SARVLSEPLELEEERRLCYVAITRAKQRLYLTAAKQRRTYNMTRETHLSRFLKDIPQELLEDVTPAASEGAAQVRLVSAAQRASYRGFSANTRSALTGRRQEEPEVKYDSGETVIHRKFGRGIITEVKESGGDQLLTILFEEVGTKLLMARFAAAMMKKER